MNNYDGLEVAGMRTVTPTGDLDTASEKIKDAVEKALVDNGIVDPVWSLSAVSMDPTGPMTMGPHLAGGVSMMQGKGGKLGREVVEAVVASGIMSYLAILTDGRAGWDIGVQPKMQSADPKDIHSLEDGMALCPGTLAVDTSFFKPINEGIQLLGQVSAHIIMFKVMARLHQITCDMVKGERLNNSPFLVDDVANYLTLIQLRSMAYAGTMADPGTQAARLLYLRVCEDMATICHIHGLLGCEAEQNGSVLQSLAAYAAFDQKSFGYVKTLLETYGDETLVREEANSYRNLFSSEQEMRAIDKDMEVKR